MKILERDQDHHF